MLRQTFNKLKRSSNSSWPQIETMLGDTVVLSNEAVEQVAREFGWQDVWMTQPATAKAKAKALLTSMSGAVNSYVVPKAASVATSASPPHSQGKESMQMQLQMLQMQPQMRLQGLWQFPQMQLLSYLMCLAKQKASTVPGEAEVPQSQDDEAAAKCQFCFERQDAAEPWPTWVKLCVGSFVCCI